MTEVQAEGGTSAEPVRVHSWDSIIGHKTLRHEGREQISRRPTIWFGVWEARSGGATGLEFPLSRFAHRRERETISLKCLFAEALLHQARLMNYICIERCVQREKRPDKYAAATAAC